MVFIAALTIPILLFKNFISSFAAFFLQCVIFLV